MSLLNWGTFKFKVEFEGGVEGRLHQWKRLDTQQDIIIWRYPKGTFSWKKVETIIPVGVVDPMERIIQGMKIKFHGVLPDGKLIMPENPEAMFRLDANAKIRTLYEAWLLSHKDLQNRVETPEKQRFGEKMLEVTEMAKAMTSRAGLPDFRTTAQTPSMSDEGNDNE